MKIKYRGIINERLEDAPFVGALIIAPTCSNGCKGCCNQHLKEDKYLEEGSAKEIIDKVKSDPFNDGIILAGLEWSESAESLVEICKEASNRGLKIMIYTGLDLEEFHYRIGKEIAKDYTFKDLPKAFPEKELYCYLGAGFLDTAIPEDYWIKTGAYDKDKRVDDNIQFGIKLASSNQRIIKISGVK